MPSGVQVQLRGINLKTNQVTAYDKVNPGAIFISANEKTTSICIILIFVKYISVENLIKILG